MLSTVVALTKCLHMVGEGTILLERDGAVVSRGELLCHTGGKRSHRDGAGAVKSQWGGTG